MIQQTPQFKFVDRGFGRSILLIPGWATDCEIFGRLDIPYDYLLPEGAAGHAEETGKAVEALPEQVRARGIDILGWSMGGYIAADIFTARPAIFDRLILVSMRQRYDKSGLDDVRSFVKRSRAAYLKRFYGGLFSDGEDADIAWFKESLLKKYTGDTAALGLFEGLDYLAQAELKAELLNDPKVTLVHGDRDVIAPIGEASSMSARMPLAKFIVIKGAGHLPLFRKEFSDIFGAATHAR